MIVLFALNYSIMWEVQSWKCKLCGLYICHKQYLYFLDLSIFCLLNIIWVVTLRCLFCKSSTLGFDQRSDILPLLWLIIIDFSSTDNLFENSIKWEVVSSNQALCFLRGITVFYIHNLSCRLYDDDMIMLIMMVVMLKDKCFLLWHSGN